VEILPSDDIATLDATAARLSAGGLVVVPTDTVYGLASIPTLDDAVQSIYRAKGRPEHLHLPVLAASVAQVRQLGVAMSDASSALAERWWPGPLTMVFGFVPHAVRPTWLDGRDEVAVRIPQHAFLLALMRVTGVLLVTSANRHGAPTPAGAGEVAAVFGSEVSLVVDGGLLNSVPSTLVNVRDGHATVEREGALSVSAISAALAPGDRAS
jgi:L-threonylcarbamoyladenylate synthase